MFNGLCFMENLFHELLIFIICSQVYILFTCQSHFGVCIIEVSILL